MTEWKNLAGKFTEKDIELINKFQKKYGIENKSQMVRFSTLFTILFIEIMTEYVNSEHAKRANLKIKKLRKMISKLPQSVTGPTKLHVKEMQEDITKTLETIAKQKARDFSSLVEERKVGRPKAAKKRPGRPIDTGI